MVRVRSRACQRFRFVLAHGAFFVQVRPQLTENHGAMPGLDLRFVSATWFVLALPIAVAALLVLLVRHEHRGARARTRLRAGELFQLLAGRLSGRVRGGELRRAASDTGPEPFWDAIEAITTTLRVRERVALAKSLARSRHVAQERRVLRASESIARRELAAHRLGLLPSERSRRRLRRVLVRGPESLRFAAARALARHRDLGSLRWLLEHPGTLARRPMPALIALLRSFGPGARAMLITALEQRRCDPRLECACLETLGMGRCRSARPSIQSRLASPHLELRVTAARALGRLGMEESIPALMLVLTDEGWPVRAMAAQALGRLLASPAIDALVRCVSDRSWWVRHHAAYALAAIGGDGHDALCQLAASADDLYAREMARDALEFGDGERQA
jgi:HEAT repeat protein